jgi:nicotinamide-nucleotide amidase
VTYSNAAKIDMLGVEASLIAHWGAVSEPVVAAMVGGALDRSQADLAVAVTGIAGPTGGTPDKPIGTVWFGLAHRPYPVHTFCRYFDGDRQAVRQQAVVTAIGALIQLLDDEDGVLS